MKLAKRWTTADIITACRFCWMCRHVCTVGNVTSKESHTPRGKMLVLYSKLAEMNISDQEISELVHKCALCYRCTENCVSGVDVPQVILNTRIEMTEEGNSPSEIREAYKALREQEERAVSAYAKSRDYVRNIVGELPTAAHVVLFGGRGSNMYVPGAIIGASKILNEAGVEFTVPKQECWSGYEFYEIGFLDDAIRIARETVEALASVCDNSNGIPSIITLDPSDNWALGHLYSQWGLDIPFNIIDFSSYVKNLVDMDQIRFRGAGIEICYHDPCHLGRLQRVFSQPREVLSSIQGLVIREMYWNREQAYCCGGHIRSSSEDVASKAASNLVQEIRATKTRIVVTACSTCCDSLKHADNDLGVYHIAEFLAQYLI